MHLAFGHFKSKERQFEWNSACCAYVGRFLNDLKIGQAPEGMNCWLDLPGQDEEAIYRRFCEEGVPPQYTGLSTAGPAQTDMVISAENVRHRLWGRKQSSFEKIFANALKDAVRSAVNIAGGLEPHLGAETKLKSIAQRAQSWFISSYPLLGALAASFTLIEDARLCQAEGISIAAVNPELREIYVNPHIKLDELEMRFVLAHELLHVGLRHDSRKHGRDHYLWNIACDYVINSWLVEMAIGDLPQVGILYDPTLKGMSAEEIYLTIVSDIRRYRKLATLRGVGLGDILERGRPDWLNSPEGSRFSHPQRATSSIYT